MDERFYWLAFSTIEGIGPLRFKLLLEYFGSAEKAWKANHSEFSKIGLPYTYVKRILEKRENLDIEKYVLELGKREIKFLTLNDSEYSKGLKEIPDAPFVLYVKGNLRPSDFENAFGVVGTRKMTYYGKEVTERIVLDLVASGLTIVSGMARGIDTVAHRAAIESGGRTIAVLGCGVDVVYPPENRELYFKILQNGAVISEVPLEKGAEKGAFPQRNRIISGVSMGVLVCEGAKDSGSLITARCAAEQGREVFAVPGPITSKMSEGPSYLISQGAKMVTSAEDILEELGSERLF